jgi:hypothetical protein
MLQVEVRSYHHALARDYERLLDLTSYSRPTCPSQAAHLAARHAPVAWGGPMPTQALA